MTYDKIIIGAGIYGLYSALYSVKKGEKVIVLEYDDDAFKRASYINQARVHNGYHYPRSLSTAKRSSQYFERFNKQFDFAINNEFKKVYAISSNYSWTSSKQFEKFCNSAEIKCNKMSSSNYFKKGMCDGVFDTRGYAFDAQKIKEYLLSELAKFSDASVLFNARIEDIILDNKNGYYKLELKNNNEVLYTEFLLNATYASINQILNRMNFEMFEIKYEICEMIICKVNDELENVGVTVMDGPFFSVMPFGKTGLHSLTSVTFTPHTTSYNKLPTFKCQKGLECSPNQLENCNTCVNRPESAWDYMNNLANKYLKDSIEIGYEKSLFSIKPILKSSEIDDSRPTVIKQFTDNPKFISVLSGKFNTIYDLEEVL